MRSTGLKIHTEAWKPTNALSHCRSVSCKWKCVHETSWKPKYLWAERLLPIRIINTVNRWILLSAMGAEASVGRQTTTAEKKTRESANCWILWFCSTLSTNSPWLSYWFQMYLCVWWRHCGRGPPYTSSSNSVCVGTVRLACDPLQKFFEYVLQIWHVCPKGGQRKV